MSSPIAQGTVDALAAVTSAALSPVVNGPLLLAVLLRPDAVGRVLVRTAEALPVGLGARLLSPPPNLRGARTTLGVLFAVGLARLANRALSQAASNAWRWSRTPGWDGDWSSEVAVVTGGCSGIGMRIVERLVRLGARVAILDVQELPTGDQEGSDLRGSPLVRCYRCDVSSAESVAEAGQALRADFGAAPSVLVNNAGIIHLGGILAPSEAELRRRLRGHQDGRHVLPRGPRRRAAAPARRPRRADVHHSPQLHELTHDPRWRHRRGAATARGQAADARGGGRCSGGAPVQREGRTGRRPGEGDVCAWATRVAEMGAGDVSGWTWERGGPVGVFQDKVRRTLAFIMLWVSYLYCGWNLICSAT